MRTIFDCDVFVSQRVGGVSRYITQLAKHLVMTDTEVITMCGLHVNDYVQDLPSALGCRVPEIRGTFRIRRALSRQWQNRLIRRLPIDDRLGRRTVVHKTWYDSNRFDSRFPIIVTIYDLIPEMFGKRTATAIAAATQKRIVCEGATEIIAISETTKRDLINLYAIPEERVHVTHLGVHRSRRATESRARSGEDALLLFVGSRGLYKNFSCLPEAIASSRFLKRNCKVLCCGGGPFTKSELEKINSLGLSDVFTQVSPSDSELDQLYRSAQVLVVPSLYEGFGLPLLEAMSHGCCVACSNRGSLPEVGGDAAVFFDPTDRDDIASVLEKVCSDHALHEAFQLKGFARSELFSWEKCAASTKAIYGRALARNL